MNSTRATYLAMATVAFAGMALSPAHATIITPINVKNFDFDNPATTGYTTAPPTDWTDLGSPNYVGRSGVQNLAASQSLYPNTTFSDNALNFGYINGGDGKTDYTYLHQAITTPVISGDTYTFQTYLGFRPSTASPVMNCYLVLNSFDGAHQYSNVNVGNQSQPAQAFTQYTTAFTATDAIATQANASGGLQIEYQLFSGGQLDFHDATLTDTSPAPEPAQMATLFLVGLGLGGLLLRSRRAKVNSAAA